MECPFCDRPMEVHETTPRRAAAAGLVYLEARCQGEGCRVRIDAAGIDQKDADKGLALLVYRRQGTTPERWTTRPRPERRKGKR